MLLKSGHSVKSCGLNHHQDCFYLARPKLIVFSAFRKNNRTGRIRLDDPNRGPPQTYLDVITVQANLSVVERTPESAEFLYRRVMVGVLKHFFSGPYFEVYRDVCSSDVDEGVSRPDWSVVQSLSRPGGSLHQYDYCYVECKEQGRDWKEAFDDLARHCGGNGNDSGEVYGIVQVGL